MVSKSLTLTSYPRKILKRVSTSGGGDLKVRVVPVSFRNRSRQFFFQKPVVFGFLADIVFKGALADAGLTKIHETGPNGIKI
jgi:hypothetical protein